MWSWILGLAWSGAPEDVASRLPEARAVLEVCAQEGCDDADGAEAAWFVAVGTYLETGVADGELAATVRLLDEELFADLPDVVRQSATDAAAWAMDTGPRYEPLAVIPIETAMNSIAIPMVEAPSDAQRRGANRDAIAQLNFGPVLDDPELLERLEESVNVCFVPLDRDRYESLRAARTDDDTYIHVTLPSPTAPSKLVMWGLSRDRMALFRIHMTGRPVPVVPAEGAHVVLLPYDEPRGGAPRAIRPVVGEDAAYDELVAPRIVKQLMEDPNECVPELDPASLDAVGAIADAQDGPVFFVVHDRQKWAYVWRWDPELRNLGKVIYR